MTNTYTDKNGKFANGNPGKPKGARHKATKAALALLDGEAEAHCDPAGGGCGAGGRHNGAAAVSGAHCPAKGDAPIKFALPPMQSVQDVSEDETAKAAYTIQKDLA